MKYITNLQCVPPDPHWVIIEVDQIIIRGDERSRSCPGHGYPEHTESQINYIAFTDEQEWKLEIIKRLSNNKSNFKALRVLPATPTLHTTVEVKY
jgi:hypothetical protein